MYPYIDISEFTCRCPKQKHLLLGAHVGDMVCLCFCATRLHRKYVEEEHELKTEIFAID